MPKITMHAEYDCTHGQLVQRLAGWIYETHGASLPPNSDIHYLLASQHPTEISVLAAAEQIFCEFWGDTPDYSEDIELKEGDRQ